MRQLKLHQNANQNHDKENINGHDAVASPFQSPPATMLTNYNTSRKRSVFALGSAGGKKPYTLGSKKKLPPSGGGRRLSIFRTPSFTGNANNHNKKKGGTSTTKTPAAVTDDISRPLFTNESDTESTAEMRESISDDYTTNNEHKTMATMKANPSHPSGDEFRKNKLSEALIDEMRALEVESHRKDERLRHLNDQLHKIQRGLSGIDEERASLQGQVKLLEDEKQKIQTQLDLREKEILTLVKRCSNQEDKMRESTLLRSKNQELEQENEELRAAMENRTREENQLSETKQELEKCKEKLENLKRDHDSMADTLRGCIATIKKLTAEKEEWEDERRRLMNRAEVEIEKERLKHVEEINELKVQMQTRQDKIDKLEEFMKDKSMTNLKLRKENAELNKWKTQMTVKLEQDEKQIAELSEENKEKSQELEQLTEGPTCWTSKLEEKEQTIASLELEISKLKELQLNDKESHDEAFWTSRLVEKESMIASLEDEISNYMSRAMSTSECIEVLQLENEELEDEVEELTEKLESFKGWEGERDALLHCLSVSQAEIKDLIGDNVLLEIKNESLEEENKQLLSATDTSGDVQILKKEMAEKEAAWRTKEKDLKNQLAAFESENIIARTQCDGLEERLEAALKANRALEAVVNTGNNAVNMEDHRKLLSEKDEDIENLKQNLAEARRQNESDSIEIGNLRKQNYETSKILKENQLELSRAQKAINETGTKLTQAKEKLRAESESSIQDEEQKVLRLQSENSSLQEELKNFRTKTKALGLKLERKECELLDVQKQVEDYKLTIKEVQAELSQKTAEVSKLFLSIAEGETQIESLKSKLNKSETDLVLKNDEIRDLRMIELKDLEDEVSELRESIISKEGETKKLLDRLNEYSHQQKEHENNLVDEMNALKSTVASLRNELQLKETEFSTYQIGKKELESSNVSLQRKNTILEKSLQSLREENSLVLASETSMQSEKQKLENKLQSGIDAKEKISKELETCQLQVRKLERSLSEVKEQRAESDKILKERSKLLTEMVEINETLQSQIDSFSTYKSKVSKLQVERDELADTVCREQSLRGVLEAELSSLHEQLAKKKKDSYSVEALKIKNDELHAKIKRQEAFMKKKLHKEKVARGRSSSRNVLGSVPNKQLGSPMRNLGSPMKPKSRTPIKNRLNAFEPSRSENQNPNFPHLVPSESGDFS